MQKETTPHSFKVYHSAHLSPFTQIALVLKGYCTQDAWLQVRFSHNFVHAFYHVSCAQSTAANSFSVIMILGKQVSLVT